MDARRVARELAHKHLSAGDPVGWFEALYASASGDASAIPWADRKPNPNIVGWLDARPAPARGRALKVGCGLGDDAEELARRGFEVTAFDVAPTAVEWCRRRFAGSAVRYVVADLLDPPEEWGGAFDLVVEAYTLQVLPPEVRGRAVKSLAGFLAPGGRLLLVCRGREPGDDRGTMPWPLTRGEVDDLTRGAGLLEEGFEDYLDDERPPVRRFRGVYRTPGQASNAAAGRR